MWIMIIKKLPIAEPPPKFSIFWSVHWPDEKIASQQLKLLADEIEEEIREGRSPLPKRQRRMSSINMKKDEIREEAERTARLRAQDEEWMYFSTISRDPNWIAARRITYQGQEIRVFPHEFSKLSNRNLAFYLMGTGNDGVTSHELVPESVAEIKFQLDALDGDLRPVYDAALVDGCTPGMAYMVAMGVDVNDEAPDVLPMGWYRLRQEFHEMVYGMYGDS